MQHLYSRLAGCQIHPLPYAGNQSVGPHRRIVLAMTKEVAEKFRAGQDRQGLKPIFYQVVFGTTKVVP
jgi:hypothetical protein